MADQDENNKKEVATTSDSSNEEALNEEKDVQEAIESSEEDKSEEQTETPGEGEAEKEDSSTTPQKEYDFNVGDTIVVGYKIKEDNRERVQNFEGVVIAKRGSGVSKTFTVRKIGNNNVGVERIFPLYSPNIADITVKRRGKVRRAKLYYLRNRKGRAATYVKPASN